MNEELELEIVELGDAKEETKDSPPPGSAKAARKSCSVNRAERLSLFH
jgi:hypothetical protein